MARIMAEHVRKALDDKGANLPCPRCGGREFGVMDGLLAHPVQTGTGSIELGGKTLPVAVTCCENCGYVAQHLLTMLGVLKTSSQH